MRIFKATGVEDISQILGGEMKGVEWVDIWMMKEQML